MDDQRPYAVVALMQCDAVASAGFVNECGEDLGRQPGGWVDPRNGKRIKDCCKTVLPQTHVCMPPDGNHTLVLRER